jgi:putative ABC transport system permease protein
LFLRTLGDQNAHIALKFPIKIYFFLKLRMVSIARKTLFHDLAPFLVAQAGVVFSVSLMCIQVGLYYGFTRSTSVIVDRSTADLWVVSSELQHLDLTLPIPYKRLREAQGVAGVDRAEAFIFQEVVWQHSKQPIAPVTIIGFEQPSQLFQIQPIIQGKLSDLQQTHTGFLNESDVSFLSAAGQIGDTAKLGPLEVKLTGLTRGIRSMVSSPFLFTSLENGSAFVNEAIAASHESLPSQKTPRKLAPNSNVTAILIRAKPGQSLSLLKQALVSALPGVQVYTKTELSQKTRTYWLENTGVTFILGMGAVVAVIVGMAIVSQILYTSVVRHLGEFATLKAMGASNRFLYRIILEQALWMGLLGYIPGLGLCMALGTWTLQTQAVLILITPASAVGIFGITLIMCAGSAIIAIQKVVALDPVLVFTPS